MIQPPSNGSNGTRPAEVPVQRFIGALIGLLIGQVVGDNSVTIAKLLLYISQEDTYQKWNVTQIALVVIFIFTLIGVWMGTIMARRGWVDNLQIVLSVVTALVVALFTIVDQTLPDPKDGTKLPFLETSYYLVWPVLLLLVPVFILPNRGGNFDSKIRHGMRILAITTMMALCCWITGYGLVRVFEMFHDLEIDFVNMKNGASILKDRHKFWLANPSTVNPIAGALFSVAFVPLWWKGLWQGRKVFPAFWVVGFVVFSSAYAAVYGLFYQERECWITKIENPASALWSYSLGIGALSAVMALAVLVAFLCAREKVDGPTGFPVSGRFWWLLPPGLAAGFAVVVLVAFRPIVLEAGASSDQVAFLTVAHAVNGILLGFTFRIFKLAMRWVRAV